MVSYTHASIEIVISVQMYVHRASQQNREGKTKKKIRRKTKRDDN